MFTTEPSYFDFLMQHRCGRRLRVAPGQTAGIMPDLASATRLRRPQRVQFGQKIAPGR